MHHMQKNTISLPPRVQHSGKIFNGKTVESARAFRFETLWGQLLGISKFEPLRE